MTALVALLVQVAVTVAFLQIARRRWGNSAADLVIAAAFFVTMVAAAEHQNRWGTIAYGAISGGFLWIYASDTRRCPSSNCVVRGRHVRHRDQFGSEWQDHH